MTGEDSAVHKGVSKRMSLVVGARRHLECGHQKHIMDTIQSHPTQVLLSILSLLVVCVLNGAWRSKARRLEPCALKLRLS